MKHTNDSKQTEQPTLLILAAGMGSRFGGIKQIEPIGPRGELIIDYSIFDAIRAGFDKVVFVIRREIEQDFCEQFFNRIKKIIKAEYVFQEMPSWRKKPLGTTHAVLAARNCIKGPFCVINADDYYGREAYETMAKFLRSKDGKSQYAMVGYKMHNTLSDNGTVNRGVIYTDANDNVAQINEIKGIEKRGNKMGYMFNDTFIEFAPDTNVSMTFFGFSPDIFPHLNEKFSEFLVLNTESQTAECILADSVGELIKEGTITLKMFECHDKWLGVTYRDDKEFVKSEIELLINKGIYPSPVVTV